MMTIMNKRKISNEILNETLENISSEILNTLPSKPEKLLNYAVRLEKPNISPNIKQEIKEMMIDNLLSDEEYLATYFSILSTFFYKKTSVTNPKLHLVLGQTGSGKSNVTAKLLKEDNNIVVIDSDKYKHYRPDAENIAKNNPTLYGFLTGPDAYGHRDNIYEFAVDNKYNILIEIAPSIKNGLFNVDIEKLIERGYSIDVHTLAVSNINSALSIHERYEGQIETNLATPKLTDLERHNESFRALNKIIKEIQNNKQINNIIYKRAENKEDYPSVIYQKDILNNFTCPYEALLKCQNEDTISMGRNFNNRYNVVLKQMNDREAEYMQYKQLKDIKEMHEKHFDKYRKGSDKVC